MVDIVQQVSTDIVLSDKSEAEAGTNNTKFMTPLRTKEAISASEVPLPDVWIPFNNDLKMITGYGSDVVRVGEDTLKIAGENNATFTRASNATYIDKSGVLRTAGINEPRFEKEGLLIEGASTNTHAYRDYTNSAVSKIKCTCELSTNENGIQWYKQIATGDGGAYVYLHSANSQTFELGVTYTYSLTVKRGTTNTTRIHFHTDSFPGNTNGVFNFDSGTFELIGSGVTGSSVVRLHEGVYRISLTAVCTKADGSRSPLVWQSIYVIGDAWFIADPQIEALPFATSYIPTNGTQVTRAADIISLPKLLNIPTSSSFTFACNALFRVTKTFAAYIDFSGSCSSRLAHVDPAAPTQIWYETVWRDSTDASTRNNLTNTTLAAGALCCTRLTKNASDFKLLSAIRSGVEYQQVETTHAGAPKDISGGINEIYIKAFTSDSFGTGHIRNLRIWHTALTDTQIAALK